jgi:hypothetical protein
MKNQQHNKEYYEVYTQKCMAFLVSKGFVLQGLKPSLKNPKFNNFLFKDSEEIRQAVNEYLQNK